MKAMYPNYMIDPSYYLWAQGVPDGKSPDATAYAAGRAPASYYRDNLHPTDAASTEVAMHIGGTILASNWDR
jgi:hypothetical protein